MNKKKQTESRKKDHVELVLSEGGQYKKTSGFERIDFVHNALPEMSPEDVDLSTDFLDKTLDYPVLITGMTGGYADGRKINRDLAKIAEKYGLAFGVGSQRAMIEKPSLSDTYKIRDVAPTIPILANIGAYQLKNYNTEQIRNIIDSIDADGLAIHLNALQEVVQPEGDTDFNGILDSIRETCRTIGVPVVVKETGAGIGNGTALELKKAGVKYIDVAGAGGTSWSIVESHRSGRALGFENWGIPTVDCIIQCKGIVPVIASGGIRNGIQGAKAIALGSELCGAAYPFLKAWKNSMLDQFTNDFLKQLNICSYLTGSRTIKELQKAKLFFC